MDNIEEKLEKIHGCLKTTHNQQDFEECTGMTTQEARDTMAEGQRKGIL